MVVEVVVVMVVRVNKTPQSPKPAMQQGWWPSNQKQAHIGRWVVVNAGQKVSLPSRSMWLVVMRQIRPSLDATPSSAFSSPEKVTPVGASALAIRSFVKMLSTSYECGR